VLVHSLFDDFVRRPQWLKPSPSIYQENRALRSFRLCGKLLCAVVIVVEDAHSHPPVSCGAGETEHFSSAIAAGEMVREFRWCAL